MKENNESFKSRLGFLLVSAGCAIGIGNVWKFPYMCGEYGGAAFIIIYLIFLVILGIPVMSMEFAVGRASRLSIAKAFDKLDTKNGRWGNAKFVGVIGCYALMMFYTTVAGWMLYYCVKEIKGDFVGATSTDVSNSFSNMLGSAPNMAFWTIVICIIGFLICSLGVQKGLEKITKWMMIALLVIMVILAIHSVTMNGSGEGIKFYLIPDFGKVVENGVFNVIFGALSQAFFTLSLGIGAMTIFGSYIGKERTLAGEAIQVTILDTFVALVAGLIVIPACFSYGVAPNSGPSLIFLTLPNIFANMAGGRIWGFLFFIFMSFAALSTVIAVFENIIKMGIDLFDWTRKKSVLINGILMIVLSMPCVFGFNIWAGVQPLGTGTGIMDLEDFIVSNNLLPLGSLLFVLFCTKKSGWGWENAITEINTGKGIKLSNKLRGYLTYGLPIIIIVIYLKGYYDFFKAKGTVLFIVWMIIAVLLLLFIFFTAGFFGKKKNKASIAE